MTLLLNDDQREFQHTLRSVFEKQADSKRVRAVQAAGTDFDREAWAALVELGATTTLIPEEFDGLGLGRCRSIARFLAQRRSVPLTTTPSRRSCCRRSPRASFW